MSRTDKIITGVLVGLASTTLILGESEPDPNQEFHRYYKGCTSSYSGAPTDAFDASDLPLLERCERGAYNHVMKLGGEDAARAAQEAFRRGRQ